MWAGGWGKTKTDSAWCRTACGAGVHAGGWSGGDPLRDRKRSAGRWGTSGSGGPLHSRKPAIHIRPRGAGTLRSPECVAKAPRRLICDPIAAQSLSGPHVGRAILPAAGFQPASRLKGGCGQDWPPHRFGHTTSSDRPQPVAPLKPALQGIPPVLITIRGPQHPKPRQPASRYHERMTWR